MRRAITTEHPLHMPRTFAPHRFRPRLLPALAALALGSVVSPWEVRATSSPEQEFKALKALREIPPPAHLPRVSDAALDWSAVRNAELHDRALAFLAAHPTSPLRWDVVMLLTAPPPFTKQVTENGETRTVRDVDAYRAWMTRYFGMVEELLVARDASASARTAALSYLLNQVAMNWRTRFKTPEGQVMLRKAEGWWTMFERNHRASPALINGARSMAQILDVVDPARCEQFLLRLHAEYRGKKAPDPAIYEMAEGRLKLLHGQAFEVWLQLRAIDGQFADTRDYRGKIVVLALFPVTLEDGARFLGEVHASLQPKGVEIIHVATGASMDRTAPDLTEAEAAALIAEWKYPWRIAYDGKNAFGGLMRRLGLNAYPVYLVLSRDGRFVAETSSPRVALKAIETELSLPPEPAVKR